MEDLIRDDTAGRFERNHSIMINFFLYWRRLDASLFNSVYVGSFQLHEAREKLRKRLIIRHNSFMPLFSELALSH